MAENLVLQATDENLLDPNWDLVMQIVDGASVSPSNANAVYNALRKRMDSPNPKIAHLALIVYDACMKNCTDYFHTIGGSKKAVSLVAKIASGDGNCFDESVVAFAAKVIQELTAMFHGSNKEVFFQHYYDQLKREGNVVFSVEHDVPAGSSGSSSSKHSASSRVSSNASSLAHTRDSSRRLPSGTSANISGSHQPENSSDDLVDSHLEKLSRELKEVEDVVDEMVYMLYCDRENVLSSVAGHLPPDQSGSILDTAFQSKRDFIKSCSPRLHTLIERGHAVFGEDLLQQCLRVFDRVREALKAATDLQKSGTFHSEGYASLLKQCSPAMQRKIEQKSGQTLPLDIFHGNASQSVPATDSGGGSGGRNTDAEASLWDVFHTKHASEPMKVGSRNTSSSGVPAGARKPASDLFAPPDAFPDSQKLDAQGATALGESSVAPTDSVLDSLDTGAGNDGTEATSNPFDFSPDFSTLLEESDSKSTSKDEGDGGVNNINTDPSTEQAQTGNATDMFLSQSLGVSNTTVSTSSAPSSSAAAVPEEPLDGIDFGDMGLPAFPSPDPSEKVNESGTHGRTEE